MNWKYEIGRLACVAVVSCACGVANVHAAEGGAHHPHHVAAAVGVARHKNKNSEFWGVDYAYTFQNRVFLQGFYEQVRGEFNISAFGVQIGRRFGHGGRAAIGPGFETKLKSGKELALLRVTFGYDWHSGSWSYGPVLSYDLIEDESDAGYLGFAVGYGF